MENNIKLAIYGAGSLGTILGAYVTKAGTKVDLINHNKSHVAGLKKNGAHVTGTVDLTVPVTAMLPEEMNGKYDIIFLMTKQLDNANVVRFLTPFLKDDGVICTAQNGLPELLIAEIIGEDRTFGCIIGWGATMIREGMSELTSSPDSLGFGIGALNNSNPEKLQQIKKVLELMGNVEIKENFIGARWSKLIINCVLSGMSSVQGCSFGEVMEDKASRLCAQRILKECIDVAKKTGIKVEPFQGKDIVKLFDYNGWLKQKISFAILPFAVKKHRFVRASMLQDLEKGKKCEIDAINGILCTCARKVGLPTPYNDRVVELVHKIENGELKPSSDNIRFFYGLK